MKEKSQETLKLKLKLSALNIEIESVNFDFLISWAHSLVCNYMYLYVNRNVINSIGYFQTFFDTGFLINFSDIGHPYWLC